MSEPTYSLFIIKTNTQSLKGAESFLKNRKWTVGTAVNMREALAYIIQKQPQYIMICSDHPNKKVKVLPKLLSQAFPAKIIAYTDSNTPSAMSALRDMNQTYNLFPPISGPSIERIILKIIKDEELQKEEAKNRKEMGTASGESNADSGTIRLSGEIKSEDEVKRSFEQARAALSHFVNSGDHDENHSPTGAAYIPDQVKDNKGSNSYMTQGGEQNSSFNQTQQGPGYNPGFNQTQQGPGYNPGFNQTQQGPGYNPGFNQTQQGPGYNPGFNQTQQGPGYNPGFNQTQQGPGYNPGFNQTQQGPGYNPGTPNSTSPELNSENDQQQEGESFAEWEERMRKNMQFRAQAAAAKNQTEDTKYDPSTENPFADRPTTAQNDPKHESHEKDNSATSDINPDNDNYPRGKNKKGTPIMESDDIATKGKRALYIRGEKKEQVSNESIVIKGSVDALDQTVIDKNDVDPSQIQHIEKSTNVACITIQSQRFSGYLVAALGKNRKIDQEFIESIKKRLFSFLKANGEQVHEEDSRGLQIKEVEFEDWAVKHAEFLRKSVHDGDEIAMAFFPHREVNTTLDASASEKMLKMSLDEFKEDVALEFDLYMYMPENNKYLLYTPQNKPFYKNQKGRLKEKGITHMHLRKESLGDVKKYRAQNYLNEKIEAYKAAQKIKQGG